MSEPSDKRPAVEERFSHLREMATSDPYAALLGVKVVEPDPTCLRVAVDIKQEHTNFMGLVHGGVVYSLADIALSLISNAEVEAVALDTHLVQAASATAGDRLVATARPATRSRSVATYQISVARGDERIIGLFTGTVFHRVRRPGGADG
jgi:acyl-CoA thioesterase